VLRGEHERLAAEEQEVRPLSLNGCLHLFQVVRAGDVAGLTLRVLVAVLAGDVALDADGPEFYRHGAGSRTADSPVEGQHPRLPVPLAGHRRRRAPIPR